MGAMRVPSPAAGIITITFMAGCKYTSAEAGVQISGNPADAHHRLFPISIIDIQCRNPPHPETFHGHRSTTSTVGILERRAHLQPVGRCGSVGSGTNLLQKSSTGEGDLALKPLFQVLRSARPETNSQGAG